MDLVATPQQALMGIRNTAPAMAKHPELAAAAAYAHAVYVAENADGSYSYGFSKFVGYAGMTGARYLETYKKLDGRNTEVALRPFFEELNADTKTYKMHLRNLSEWLAKYGKTPRKGVRFMVLKREYKEENPTGEDRRLLDLMIAVADLLPTDQRHELRAKL